MKLTKVIVEKLDATGKRYNIFDDDLKGFAVRVGAKGDRSFYYVYRAGKGRGAPLKWLRLGSFPTMTVEQARRLCREKAASVALGADPAKEVREEKEMPDMQAALEKFFAEHVEAKLKQSSVKEYRRTIDYDIVPAIGKLKVTKVEYRHIAAFHHEKKDVPSQANRAVAMIAKFFSWAEKNGYCPRGSNPCVGIERYRENKRLLFMGEKELAAIGAAIQELENAWHTHGLNPRIKTLNPKIAAAIRLLCFTGARRMEILSLRWENVDLESGTARLPDSKTGFKILQLPQAALDILQDIPQCSEWVFPNSQGDNHLTDIHHQWKKVCQQAGLKGWRIHDLRHAFASMMVNSGASLPIIGKILGHSQVQTACRYAHLEQNPARKAAEDAATKIAAALATPRKKATVIEWKQAGGQ